MPVSYRPLPLCLLGLMVALVLRGSTADCLQAGPRFNVASRRRTTRQLLFQTNKVHERASAVTISQVATLRGGALSPEALSLAKTLAPKVGILTSTALYFAPAASVLHAMKNEDIGSLNTLPLAIMSIVSVSWLAYGIAARDPYVALSNICGCVGSIGYILGILPLLTQRRRQLRTTQGVILAGSAAVLSLWTYLGLSHASADRVTMLLGLFASTLFVILSGSPLSTIRTVVARRESSSILGTLTAAQVINTSLWSVYGLAIADRFVWGPNVVGLGLGLVQLALKIAFPAKKQAMTSI